MQFQSGVEAQSNMSLAFLTNDPRNSVVINASSGNVLYEISTSWPKLFGPWTTTMYDAAHRVVATVEQPAWGFRKVTFDGHTREVREWLQTKTWKM